MSTETRSKRVTPTCSKCVSGKFKSFCLSLSKRSYQKCWPWEYLICHKVCQGYHDFGEGGCGLKRTKTYPPLIKNMFTWLVVRRSKPRRNDVPLASKLLKGIKIVITHIDRPTGFNIPNPISVINLTLVKVDPTRLNRPNDSIRKGLQPTGLARSHLPNHFPLLQTIWYIKIPQHLQSIVLHGLLLHLPSGNVGQFLKSESAESE